MKKSVLFLILIFTHLCFANEALNLSEPNELRETFIASQSEKRKSIITYDEMIFDLNYLIYYFKTAYIGYDKMLKNGFNEEDFFTYFQNKYIGQVEIDTYDFYKSLSNYLKDFPDDMHFALQGTVGREYVNLMTKKFTYFSDVFVQKNGNDYFVVETNELNIEIGAKYCSSEDYLFYYPAKGDEVYRVGVVTSEKLENNKFVFNDRQYVVPVKLDTVLPLGTLKYHELETEDSGYVSLSSFFIPDKDSIYRKGAEIVYNKFKNIPVKWRNKKNIIVDLRSNTGGRMHEGMAFVYSIFNKNPKINMKNVDSWIAKTICCFEETESNTVFSAMKNYLEITNETSNSYYKYCVSKLEKNQNQLFYKINKMEVVKLDKLKSYYKGKLIFITDRNTASASENLIYLAKVTLGNEKVIVIGENSLGCFEYVSVFSYLLPNSRLSINLSSRRNSMLNLFSQWHGDCYGIYPDYWSIGNDLNETIFLVTKDNEMKLKLSNIANRLM